MTCPCEQNKCAGKNPPHILAIEQPCEPVLFHRVDYPANLGDDTTVDVNELDYRNVLLVFSNDHAYLYSSDGIPTQLVGDAQDLSAIKAQIEALGGQLAEETTNREQADQNLQNQLTNLSESVDTQLDSLDASLESLDNEVEQLGNTVVQKDTAVSADVSTVTITKTTGELTADGTETALPLPVASETSAGVMNSATYNAVQDNSENIDSILGGAVVIEDLPAAPTDEQLTAAWKEATGKTELINRASIYDETNKKVWYYYENASAWKAIDATPSFSVSVATNEAAGIVKGSTEDGQVAVEADGSMSLNGYDGMQHDIDNLTQLVAGIEVPKVPTYVLGRNTLDAPVVAEYSIVTKPNQILRQYMYNKSTGSEIQRTTTLLPVTSEYNGLMMSADKAKLDSLLEIKSLNDSLELDENGQLSVVGGGSDVNLLSEYTATVGDNDAYNASYMNGKLDGLNIVLGRGASSTATSTNVVIGWGATAREGSVTIGYNAKTQYSNAHSSVAIGREAGVRAYSTCGIALGYGAVVGDGTSLGLHKNSQYSVALGNSARCSAPFQWGVALGAYSSCGRSSEVSIGDGSSSTSYGTRYLANVRAGELDTDAVNLKQMQDYVAENAGNPFTEMETTRVQNLPPAVVTGFEDTTYGTDTITMHLDTKDLATGGVSVQELELEGATANTDEAGGHAGLMTAFQATQLAALAAGGAGGLTPDEVTKVQNLGTGSLTNMDGVLQTEEAVEIEFTRQNLVAGGSTTQTATIAAATTEEAGVMTPAMVAQLNQIGDIATVLETLTTGAGV